MPKQEKEVKKDLLTKSKESLELLKQQQADAKATWERCQGAIEVLEKLISEE
tara:strand:- start:386 stop:541 length:156 start_codon:yes stop_codon:yes gene_type:complete